MYPPRTETISLGRYRLVLELASGGMATAYIARAKGAAGFERLVVIKRVHRHLLKNREFYEMFVDEAKLASTVRHPNVVPVIDVVESEGELFLVLEYVESVSLAKLAAAAKEAGERLPPSVVSRIVSDTLAGLHAAHEAKNIKGEPISIVHRDVSPQNIIVGVDGTSRLIDFGIAKAAGRLSNTTGGVMKGKLGYMAPEQAKQQPLDRRADVFAAGIVLHEALTGQRLFDGEDAGDILLSLLVTEVVEPSKLVPGLDPAIDDVVNLALARDREQRFENASAFMVALEQAIPPAPSREVAQTVKVFVGGELARRREELQRILEDPDFLAATAKGGGLARSAVEALARTRVEEPVTEVSSVVTPRALGPRQLAAGGLVLGGAALAVILAVALRSSPDPAPERATGATSTNASTTTGAGSATAAPLGAEDGSDAPRAGDVPPEPSATASAPPPPATSSAASVKPPKKHAAPPGNAKPPPPATKPDPGLHENPYGSPSP